MFNTKKNEKIFKNNVWFFDFETLTYESKDYKKLKHTKVILIYGENFKNEKNYLFYNLKNFFDDFIFKIKKNSVIYFHNLSFDGNFIIKYLLKNYPKNLTNKYRFNGVFGYEIFKRNRCIYNIKICINDINIYFRCSYLILSTSIKKLGEQFNLLKNEKIDELINLKLIKNKKEFYNYGHCDLEHDNSKIAQNFIDYCKNDVFIQKTAFKNFYDELNNTLFNYSHKFKQKAINIFKCNTITSIIKQFIYSFVHETKSKEIFNGMRINIKNYPFYKKWFSGGFTQFNNEFIDKIINFNCAVFDINSSYPFQMIKNLPFGELREEKFCDNDICFLQIKLKKICIKREYKNFPILKNWNSKTEQRYICLDFNIEVFYTLDEWELIKKFYDVEIIYIKKYYCSSSNFLYEYITNLYELKKTKANNLTYKIFLNATFGFFAMADQYDEEYLVNELLFNKLKDNKIKEINIENKDYLITHFKNSYFFNTNFKIINVIEKIPKKLKCNNILIGAYITSKARVMLINHILKCNPENVLYCDTDSIFLKTENNPNYLANFDLGNNLGQWKKESELIKGKILGAKKYYFYEDNGSVKLGLAGINNLENFSFEDFKDKAVIYDAQNFIKDDEYGLIILSKDLIINKGKQ